MNPDELNKKLTQDNDESRKQQAVKVVTDLAAAIYTRAVAGKIDGNTQQFQYICDQSTDAALIFASEHFNIQGKRASQVPQNEAPGK